ncbi:unnamed protein product [Brachionus calyciflorus]|uniref:C2H2-type domain-containing protein n=1 Tax=Brachionus calyciflorus TaxID=104777 RepID=A0A814GHC6_9BILA|nr:unnamed protein product [Brachionus calyciflorus]
MLRCTFDKCLHQDQDSNRLILHVNTEHLNKRGEKIKCFYKECHAYFTNLRILKNHIKTKHERENISDDYFLCCDIEDCQKKWIENLGSLIIHYYTHFGNEKELKCLFKSCNFVSSSKASYKSYMSRSHTQKSYMNLREALVMRYHNFNELNESTNIQNENHNQDQSNEMNSFQNGQVLNLINKQINCSVDIIGKTKNSIQEFASNCYLKYHDRLLIPKSHCNEIMEDMNTLINLQYQLIDNITKVMTTNTNQRESLLINCVPNYLKSNAEPLIFNKNSCFFSKSSEYLREKYFVEPKEIELVTNDTSYKYQYIPINLTLKALMAHPQFFKIYFEKIYKNNEDEIERFNDTHSFKNNPLYQNAKDAFQIILYLDEFETSNPLGDNRKKYKMYAVYFKIGNLPYKYQSKSHYIQLAMLFNPELIKIFGFDRVLEPLILDLQRLEVYGIDLEVANAGFINIRGTLCFVVADNLAANGIGGFTECFSNRVQQFCRFCTGTKIDISSNLFDSECIKRDRENYQKSLISLYEGNRKFEDGIKQDSCLNKLKFFHVVDGLAPDLMHDLLEGVIPLNFRLLLRQLYTDKAYNNDQFYNDFCNFPYGRIDRKNKVPIHLFVTNPISTGNSMTMSATHMWTLIRIFPLITGDKFKDNKYFINFISLIEIFNILNQNCFNEKLITNLEKKIAIYLKQFKILYPHQNITPKQHFLIHYGRAIRTFGPPKTYSTMRFEAKHSYFKRVNQATHNHINLTYSLAMRHQRLQLYHLSSINYFSTLEYGQLQKINPDLLDFIKILISDDNIWTYNSIVINSIEYRIDDIIIKTLNQSIPCFSKIISIVKTQKYKALFIVQDFKTIEFCQFKMGYILENIETICTIIEADLIANPFPLDLYSHNEKLNQNIVVPKYPVL